MSVAGRIARFSLIVLGLVAVASGQSEGRKLVSMGMPTYPPLARQARIGGVVRVDIEINRDGSILSAVSTEEPGERKAKGLLRPAAVANARSWMFAPVGPDEPEQRRVTAFFSFLIDTGGSRVTFYPDLRVEIAADSPIIDTNTSAQETKK